MTKATTEVGTAAARHDAARDNARCARLRRGSPRPRLKGMQLTLTSRVAPIALGVDRRVAILFDEFFKRQCKRPIRKFEPTISVPTKKVVLLVPHGTESVRP